MQTLTKPHWISFFFAGGISILVSWFFSGCRIGNNTETVENPDHFSGYYVAQPESVKYYITTTHTREKDFTTSDVPVSIARYISNPVAFVIQDLNTGSAALVPPEGKAALPITLNKADHTLSYSGSTAPDIYWTDPACKSYLDVIESGTLTLDSAVASPPGNTLPLSGSIQLHIQWIVHFVGNCAATFQSLAQCYQDATECGGVSAYENEQLQAAVTHTFGPMVQSGLITLEDFPKITNYAYEVSYR